MSLRTLPPVVGRHDPDTSRAAGSEDRTLLRHKVRELLAAAPDGATDWELWEATGLGVEHKPSVVNRRRECLAVDTKRRRPSPSSRPCVVWELPAVGRGIHVPKACPPLRAFRWPLGMVSLWKIDGPEGSVLDLHNVIFPVPGELIWVVEDTVYVGHFDGTATAYRGIWVLPEAQS